MGQYYLPIFLADTDAETIVRAWLYPPHYSYNGSKLTEHSYLNNSLMNAVMFLLSPEGMFYKSRLVWAGDYADEEPSGKTLYRLAREHDAKELKPSEDTLDSFYIYIVNHTKKQYVDITKVEADSHGYRLHPLSLLTAEGNGGGGGDYRGSNKHLVGSWARDILSVEDSVEDSIPEEYEELVPGFMESY